MFKDTTWKPLAIIFAIIILILVFSLSLIYVGYRYYNIGIQKTHNNIIWTTLICGEECKCSGESYKILFENNNQTQQINLIPLECIGG